MTDAYGNIFPHRFVPPAKPLKYDQFVIVNWLHMELPQRKPLPPVIDLLKGWRNNEVFCYVRYEMPDWTIAACPP
jgi:hypothetical protein